jgi:hypothetical protein
MGDEAFLDAWINAGKCDKLKHVTTKRRMVSGWD